MTTFTINGRDATPEEAEMMRQAYTRGVADASAVAAARAVEVTEAVQAAVAQQLAVVHAAGVEAGRRAAYSAGVGAVTAAARRLTPGQAIRQSAVIHRDASGRMLGMDIVES